MRYLTMALMIGSCFAAGKPMKCGTERWSVKTMADGEAAKVSTEAVDITIKELRALPAPTDLHHIPDHRHDPVEFTRYRIHALLMAYKQEADEDFHLVLSDPADPSLTMVAEIPSSACMSPDHASTVALEQAWIISNFGKVPGVGRLKHLTVYQPVIIEGIGFFDFLHGQTGVAPNGIELHPVLSIAKVQ